MGVAGSSMVGSLPLPCPMSLHDAKTSPTQITVDAKVSGVAPANQTEESQFMNFSQGHSGTKIQCESCLFSQGRTPEFTKMGEIHELFVLDLFLVWFAGATPESYC